MSEKNLNISEARQQRLYWLHYLLPSAILLVVIFLVVSNLRGWFAAPSHLADGQAAMADENFAGAINAFSAAQRWCDTDIAARYLLGAAYHNYGWHDEALDEYDATWKLAVENGTRAMHSAGRIWRMRDNRDRARQCFERALALTPASADIWYELGILHKEAGQPDAAVAAFGEALRYEPANEIYRQAVPESTRR